MVTAGWALAVVVAVLGGTVALLGLGLSKLPQRRPDEMAATARLADGRMVLVGGRVALAGRRVALAGLFQREGCSPPRRARSPT